MIRTILFLAVCLTAMPVCGQSQELVDIVKAIGTMPDGPKVQPSNKLIEGVQALATLSEMNANDVDILRARMAVLETGSKPVVVDDQPVEVRSGFRREASRAIRAGVKSGDLTLRQGLKLRTALHSPAFLRQAENLAVTQMVFSGDIPVPMTDSGAVDRASIDWSQWVEMFKWLLPILLQLLEGL